MKNIHSLLYLFFIINKFNNNHPNYLYIGIYLTLCSYEVSIKMKKTDEEKGFVGRAWDLQHNLEARQKRIGKGKYGRVLKMARNPTNEEYEKTSKITGAGILIIGGIGFLIFLLTTQVAPWIGELLGLM
jgi:protein transport protein SEC61 subunit gamma-like protein